ncbi:MAG: InlB B-repeat-containing protein, partial [Candidatus Promineifilaceae bacterium]
MDKKYRLSRSLYFLLSLFGAIGFMLVMGRTLTAAAYSAPAASLSTASFDIEAESAEDTLEAAPSPPENDDADVTAAECPSPSGTSDASELRDCILFSNQDSAAVVITLTADIVLTETLPMINSEIILIGNDHIVDGSGSFRVFDVSSGGSLDASDIIIQNGAYTTGAAIHNMGIVSLSNSSIMSSSATIGGGIYNDLGGQLTVSDSFFSNNTSEFGGGAIYNEGEGAAAYINNSTFIDNVSLQDGGGAIGNIDSALLELTNSDFTGSWALINGGAIHNTDVGIVTILGGSIENSTASTGSGGAIFNSDVGSTVTLDNVRLANNNAGQDGGGIYNTDGAMLYLKRSILQSNSAFNGGGIALDESAAASVMGTAIDSNSASSKGGGIFVRGAGSSISIAGSSLMSNSSSDNGGGLAAESGASVDFSSGAVAANSAELSGGGLAFMDDSRLKMENSTISGNSSAEDGGAILLEGIGILSATTTVSNIASSGYGISSTGIITFASSVIAYNGVLSNCSGPDPFIVDNKFNLTSDRSCHFNDVTSFPEQDPLLSPLHDNGGSSLTHAPKVGSPILNHIPFSLNGCGTTIAVDQRGVPRPLPLIGLCDIGAFESRSYTLLVQQESNGSGLVTGTGIDCGDDCDEALPESAKVTYTADAMTGSTWVGWSGACSGVDECTVIMTETKLITASFDLNQYQLDVSIVESGTGTVDSDPAAISCPDDCGELLDYGTEITLTAAPTTGYGFSGWSGACSGEDDCTLTIAGATPVTASFEILRFELNTALDGNGVGTVASEPLGITCPDDCVEIYDYGSTITLTALSPLTSTFDGWSGACTGSGECVITITSTQAVTASFTLVQYDLLVTLDGIGTGTITSSLPGVDCPEDCVEAYDYGTAVTLTASLPITSSFEGWGGACSGVGQCALIITGPQSVTASFSLIEHDLAVIVNGNGDGVITSTPSGIDCPGDCAETYVYGTLITLTAASSDTSTFDGWSGACSGSGSCTIALTSTQAVSASFSLIQRDLTVAVGGTGKGVISSDPTGIDCPDDCVESYDHGTAVTLTALSSITSTFKGWSGACSGTDQCIVTLTSTQNVTAEFRLIQYDVTVHFDGNGSGEVSSLPAGLDCPGSCTTPFDVGTVVTLSHAADAGSTFGGWSGACTSPDSCALSMDGNHEVTATFILTDQMLYLGIDGQGGGSVTGDPLDILCTGDCEESFPYGTVVTLTAHPNITSTFSGWSGVCSGVDECIVTMTDTQNVTATFKIIEYDLVVSPEGNGSGTITSAPPGLACPDQCQSSFTLDTVVTLTVDVSFGSTFVGWGGA